MDYENDCSFSQAPDNHEYANPIMHVSETAASDNVAGAAMNGETSRKFKGFVITAILVNFCILIVSIAVLSYILVTVKTDFNHVSQELEQLQQQTEPLETPNKTSGPVGPPGPPEIDGKEC